MNNKGYYVAPFFFKKGGAATRRIIGNIKTLNLMGYDIDVIDGDSCYSNTKFEEVNVISLNERPGSSLSFFSKLVKLLLIGNNTINFLKKLKEKPSFIILYSGYSPYLLKLIPYCKKNKIKIFFDCVEWYQPKSFWEYLYKPYYWNVELAMRFLISKCTGVISISSFLERYYKAKDVKCILVPPTLDMHSLKSYKKSKDISELKVKLVYAGTPGHKDLLSEIIEIVKSFENRLELHIAGVEGNSVGNITYYGVLSHGDTLSLVSKCDYSVLLRPNNKVSKAGFSTKVVESMSLGTPMITNNTGDLSNYIVDGVNGFIFNGYDIENLKVKITEVLSEYDINSYHTMSENCILDSNVHFNYKNQVDIFELIIPSLI